MAMKGDMTKTCMGGYCGRCRSAECLVAGLVLLANVYWLKWDPWAVAGGLLAFGGLLKMAMPICPHCK